MPLQTPPPHPEAFTAAALPLPPCCSGIFATRSDRHITVQTWPGSRPCVYVCVQEKTTTMDTKQDTYLPREQGNHAKVDGNVRDPSGVVALLHLRHEGCRHRPRHHNPGAGVKVRPREELLRPKEGVDGAFDRRERSEAKQQSARIVVPVAHLTIAQTEREAQHSAGAVRPRNC